MKRGALPRRTRLKNRGALNRQSELARTAMKAKPTRRDPAEEQARALVSQRSGGRCEACGVKRASNWHHRKPRSAGGVWSADNGMDLCGSGSTGCHGWITEHPKGAREQGWSVPSWADPARTPVWIFGREFVLLTANGDYTTTEEEVA